MSCNSHPFGGGEIAVRGGVAPRSPPVPSGPASGPSGSLHTSRAWCAYVWLGVSARSPARPSHRLRVPQPGPVDQTARLSETDIAFVGAGRASTETAIAFAGEKWAFLARFWVALVSSVSTLVVQGRALVMVVSRWPVSVVVEVSLVASSPRACVLCAKKFALRGLMVGASAKKFALQAQNGRKMLFSGALGEFFRGRADEGAVLGEVFRGPAVARERRRQARKPPHLQGYDRGGTPKDPASRCVRWPCRQRQKLSARASARKQRPRSNQAQTLSSSTSP